MAKSVSAIIHGASAAAGAAGAGLAQIPGSDNAVITPIQVAMIVAIGKVHGQELSKSAALSVSQRCISRSCRPYCFSISGGMEYQALAMRLTRPPLLA